jgi:hypothetical protein
MVSVKRVVALSAVVLAVFCLGVGYGLLASEFELFPFQAARKLVESIADRSEHAPSRGAWNRVESDRTDAQDTEQLIEELRAIGYVTGSRPAVEHTGVTVFDQFEASPGFNLYCSGHGPEAFLTRMDGEVLHAWRHDFARVWPDLEVPEDATGPDYWRRVYLYPNGDLLAIFEGFGLIKIDRNSDLLWALQGGYHHVLEVTESGEIWTLDREPHVLPRIDPQRPVMEDFVAVISPDGEVTRRFSVLEAFEGSVFKPLLHNMLPYGDVFHTNSLEVLDGSMSDRSPFFRKGNLLLSILTLDTVAIIDQESESVVWALTGRWRGQHDPTVLGDGNLMVFDNNVGAGFSRVVEIDPLTQEVIWTYEGTPERPFYSKTCGTSQRLPNGNTLITESDAGRAFEVTPSKEIVWEFINTQRAGENAEYIALLPELVRLPRDFPLDWVD